MYISENRIKIVVLYGALTIFCAVFTVIYYRFSHGIYSPFLTWLWCAPLALGIIAAVMNIARGPKLVHAAAVCAYNSGAISAVVYLALCGILDIAGTTSEYTICIGVAAAVLTVAGTAMKILISKN